jgi:hypothetical protein
MEEKETKKLYLSEFVHYDGVRNITFNLLKIDTGQITVAITIDGKISVQQFDLKRKIDGRFFFEYGIMLDEIAVDDFEQVETTNI